MSETGCCPYCGLPLGGATGPDPESGADGGLGPLYHEVRRIREIAEARTSDDAARRIADLTRQVQELRATVARLRGPGVVPLPAPAGETPGRRAG